MGSVVDGGLHIPRGFLPPSRNCTCHLDASFLACAGSEDASLCLKSADNILFRRASRLRALTGDTSLTTGHATKHKGRSEWQHMKDAICRPFLITLYDPSVAYANLYTSVFSKRLLPDKSNPALTLLSFSTSISALVYSFYWAFFVSYPLVYQNIYGFSLTGEGLACECSLLALPYLKLTGNYPASSHLRSLVVRSWLHRAYHHLHRLPARVHAAEVSATGRCRQRRTTRTSFD